MPAIFQAEPIFARPPPTLSHCDGESERRSAALGPVEQPSGFQQDIRPAEIPAAHLIEVQKRLLQGPLQRVFEVPIRFLRSHGQSAPQRNAGSSVAPTALPQIFAARLPKIPPV